MLAENVCKCSISEYTNFIWLLKLYQVDLVGLMHLDQLWARYLKGDNISTKIRSGRDQDRNGHPGFLTNQDRGGQPDLSQNLGHVGMHYPSFPWFFLAFSGKKIGDNRGKSGKIGDNPDFSRLTSKIFKDRDGHLDLSRHFSKNRDGHLDLSQSVGMSRGG